MFQQSVKMSTYTVAFSVNEYEGKSKKTKSGVNVSNIVRKNPLWHQYFYANHLRVDLIENKFQIFYKFGFVTVI